MALLALLHQVQVILELGGPVCDACSGRLLLEPLLLLTLQSSELLPQGVVQPLVLLHHHHTATVTRASRPAL